MEHMELTEIQQDVLFLIASADKAMSAKELAERANVVDDKAVPLALHQLADQGLVDAVRKSTGRVYSLTEQGRALYVQYVRALQPITVKAGSGEFPAVMEPGEIIKEPSPSCATLTADQAARLHDAQLSAEARSAAGTLDDLIAAANQDPPARPDDLDDLLADVSKMVAGFRPKFPDVAEGLERLYRYVDQAYPKHENQNAAA